MPTDKKSVALITGAASNIGLAIANRFIGDFHVVGVDRSFGSEAIEKPNKQYKFNRITCDITNAKQVERVFKVSRELAPISVVINCAAISEERKTIEETTIDSWRNIVDINLTGAFIVMKVAIPYLRESKGAGVLISSRAGKVGYAGLDPSPEGTKAHYCAAKAGVNSLIKSLATELAQFQVRINGVAPGSIEGTMIPKKNWPELAKKIPLNRLGLPDEIAEATFFLCSDAATYITGHILDVNGGSLMD